MNRREFTKLLGMAGLGTVAPVVSQLSNAAEPYTGNFYISLAAIGGWDVTSFCDPKLNIAGERVINTWAESASIEQAGNIAYAPFANNKAFFERFYQDMLVVNGVDSQTNSHDDGQRHTWSGRLGFGYPTFGAIAASTLGPNQPLSLVHDSGYSETAGLTRFSRLQSPEILENLVNDNSVTVGNSTFTLYDQAELGLIEQFQNARLDRLQADPFALPRQKQGMNNLYLANSSREDLAAFADILPEQFEVDRDFRAAQLAMLAYESGLCVSAQLGFGGFDTHQTHDSDHSAALTKLTDLISFIYDHAQQGGYADRVVLTVGSDFGRTPYYNAGEGKDHWPIGSALFIQPGASWGNRVIGSTDEGHRAYALNPTTLQEDSSSGILIEPKHIQQAMRQLAGIENSPSALGFPLEATEFNFFA